MFHTFKHRTTVVHRDEKSFAPVQETALVLNDTGNEHQPFCILRRAV